MVLTEKQKISLQLRVLRIDGGQSRPEVARDARIYIPTLQHIENVANPYISIDNLVKLVDYYGWYLSDFFAVIEDRQKDWEPIYAEYYLKNPRVLTR